MIKFKNIVYKLTILVIFLLIVNSYANAQNTAAQPYLDSKHSYGVNIGLTDNNQKWYIVNSDASINVDLTDETTRDWATINAATTNGGFETVSLTFNSKNAFGATGFTTGTWYLRFEEISVATGLCVSRRQFTINIVDNTFWLEVSHAETDRLLATDGIQVYNSQNTLVNTFAAVSAPNLFTTQVTYAVTMHKASLFQPSYWQFTANFADEVESFSATVFTTNGGSAATTVVTDGSSYTVKVTPETGFNLDAVTVRLTVQYEHNVLVDVNRSLLVNEGSAVQVPALATPQPPNAITIDNITTYPEDPETPGDREQTITILAIPSTQDITFDNSTNASETAPSAASPLQNSTHYYRVPMGDVLNTGAWRLVNSSGTEVASSTSGITAAKNSTYATATISFPDTWLIGTYTLYFTETDITRTSSTQRAYTINLLAPLNVTVVLANAADATRCATVSGNIVANDDIDVPTTTTVDYTVTLNTASYNFGWSFHYEITTPGGFDADDIEVASVTVGGVANLTGDVTVAAGTTSVTVSVTYRGFYVNAHTLTLALTNITGSFNDEAANVNVSNTIYAMPQTGPLAGID